MKHVVRDINNTQREELRDYFKNLEHTTSLEVHAAL